MASTASTAVYMMPGVPVAQPPHLEGDANLATEILPGPPSVASVQQAALKRDPKKPAFSYLPPVDPGSTYTALMAGTPVSTALDMTGSRTKRTRPDKGASGRAQRASARHQNGATPAQNQHIRNEGDVASGSVLPQPAGAPLEPDVTMIIDDELSMSRSNSNSLQNIAASEPVPVPAPASAPPNGRGRPRKDKGKAKEVETSVVRIKEEPKPVSLQTPEPLYPVNNNEDHCSACRSQSSGLVYCDGCPRAFHFLCLDPPAEDIDESSKWFCPACTARKYPPRKPPQSILSPLIHHVATSIPSEFQLPEDIRTFFKDVTSGPKGAYVDSSEVKQPRLNRHGQIDERDPYRLKDRSGAPVLCFRCGTSALPTSIAAAAPAAKRARNSPVTAYRSPPVAAAGVPDGNTGVHPNADVVSPGAGETWKSIISCDYCNLHWHLDCLEPPLAHMPSFSKKWMCPNHAEEVIPLKRRIPKAHAAPIEVTQPRQFNNGNIEVALSEATPFAAPRVAVDEVLINGRRYRVPERIVMLDFWSKVSKDLGYRESTPDDESGMSSPLTSLSSLDDDLDDRDRPRLSLPPPSNTPLYSSDDVRVAQMLCGLHNGLQARLPAHMAGPANRTGSTMTPGARQTPKAAPPAAVPVPPVAGAAQPEPATAPRKRGRPRIIRPPNPITGATGTSAPAKRPAAAVNGVRRTLTSDSLSAGSASAPVLGPALRRRKSTSNILPLTSTRELRSRTRRDDAHSASSVLSTPVIGMANGTGLDGHVQDDGGKRMTAMEYLRQVGKLPPEAEPQPQPQPPAIEIVKLEDADHSSALLLDGLPPYGSASPAKPPPKKRGRKPKSDTALVNAGAPTAKDVKPDIEKPRRGRKRKQPADEEEYVVRGVGLSTSEVAVASAGSSTNIPTPKRVRTQRVKAKETTADSLTEPKEVQPDKVTKGKEKDTGPSTNTTVEKPRKPIGRPRKHPIAAVVSTYVSGSAPANPGPPVTANVNVNTGPAAGSSLKMPVTPSISRVASAVGASGSASGSAPATPSTSLKIRLPRLSNVNLGGSPQRAGLGVDTPTCL